MRTRRDVVGWVLALLVLALVTLPYWAPPALDRWLGPFSSPESAREAVRAAGPWAAAAYLVLWILQAVVAPLPAFALTLAGGAVFGFSSGLILTLVGATGGAVLTYELGRRIGVGVLGDLPEGGKMERARRLVERHGAWGVFALRLLPLFPFDPVSYLAGFSRVPFLAFLAATVVGMLPAAIALTLVGAGVIPENARLPLLLGFAFTLLAGAVVTYLITHARTSPRR